jgi:hypothetical protein
MIRARLALTPAELDEIEQRGGSVCLYGAPSPALRCSAFSCGGDHRRLECPMTRDGQGRLSLVRRRDGRTRLLVRLPGEAGPLPTRGPLAFRLNVGPLHQHAEGTETRAAAMAQCRRGTNGLRCR